MNRNKTIFIIGVAILSVIFFLFLTNKFFVSQKTNVVPSFQNEKAVSLPITGTKNQIVSDPKNLNEISSAFLQSAGPSAATETNKSGFQPIEYKDKNNQEISLDDFTKATRLKINPDIRNLLKDTDYFSFYCPQSTNQKNFGMAFSVKLFKSYRNLYSDEVRLMREWEKTILRDAHVVIFPNVNFSEADLNQEVKFRDGKYRYAEIVLPDESKSSINYDIVADYIIITSFKECLDKVHDYLEPVEP